MTQNKPTLRSYFSKGVLTNRHLSIVFIAIACFLSATTVSITSCDTPVASDSTQQTVKKNVSREELLKIIEGGWVNTEYIDALQRVNSPMFAAEAGRPVQEMAFDHNRMKGDTVYNTSGRLNYLDGERFDVILFEEGGGTHMKIYEGKTEKTPLSLDFSITGEDTMLLLINSSNSDTTFFAKQFHSSPKKGDVAVNALEYCVNNILFAGEWKNAANGSTVKFNANGTVTGWEKWTWFSVEIDKYGIEVQPDIISAYNDKLGATYVYTLDNDRLLIYKYDDDLEDGKWTRGDLVAEFNRKK